MSNAAAAHHERLRQKERDMSQVLELQDRVMRHDEVKALTGYTETHLRRLEAQGRFPRRFKLNPAGGVGGSVGWSYVEVMAWLEERRRSRELAQAVTPQAPTPAAA
jgi:predicted DNA-binding transcriptional regulator AlpA